MTPSKSVTAVIRRQPDAAAMRAGGMRILREEGLFISQVNGVVDERVSR